MTLKTTIFSVFGFLRIGQFLEVYWDFLRLGKVLLKINILFINFWHSTNVIVRLFYLVILVLPFNGCFSCQAIGKSSGGQHVSLCNQQMSSIEEVSTTQHQRQTIPESSAIINPLHSSSSTGLAFCFCDNHLNKKYFFNV